MRRLLLLFFIILSTALIPVSVVESNVDKIEEYKKAIIADPKDYSPHFGLGRAYQTLGLCEDAIKDF